MQFPHCNMETLHAPGECQFCDKHPDWQQLRQHWGINFTGKREKGFSTVPTELARENGVERMKTALNEPLESRGRPWINTDEDDLG
jgi:hypothetical protein